MPPCAESWPRWRAMTSGTLDECSSDSDFYFAQANLGCARTLRFPPEPLFRFDTCLSTEAQVYAYFRIYLRHE